MRHRGHGEHGERQQGIVLYVLCVLCGLFIFESRGIAETIEISAQVNPLDRFVHVQYVVPDDTPETIAVRARFKLKDDADWRIAAVRKLRSTTAEQLLDNTPGDDVRVKERASGEVIEHLAAGQMRTLVWETHPQLSLAKHDGVQFAVELLDVTSVVLARRETSLDIDLSDVIVPGRQMVYPAHAVREVQSDQPGWIWRDDQPTRLDVVEGKSALEPLAIQIDQTGYAAIYVSVPSAPPSQIELRLSSDLYNQRFVGNAGRECFWKVAKLDGESIIVNQPRITIEKPESINDSYRARMNYVRIVPISKELYDEATAPLREKRDKLVFAYFEPYSWAFMESVDRSSMLAEPLAAYADARVDHVDVQLGRLGSKPIYPSLIDPPLLSDTLGDSEPGGGAPTSTTVARLPAYSNAWLGFQRFAPAFDLKVAANFGAGNAYPDSTLQSLWATKNPQYLDGAWPLYKHPQVRQHFLRMYREVLEQGARRVSVDFCRYPFVADDPEIVTLFLSELRALCDEFTRGDDKVLITVRFPVPENKGGQNGVRYIYDPDPWVKQKLVDVLVPSGVMGGVVFFDPLPYIEMTRGTNVKCLPALEGLLEGPLWPGQAIRHVKRCYDLGADGIYVYQADSRIVGVMSSGQARENAHVVAAMGSASAVNAMAREMDQRDGELSTDVYLFFPQAYQGCRVRVWVDGGPVEEIQCFLDGQQVPAGHDGTYTIGKEGFADNYPAKDVKFEVRVKIRGTWIVRKMEAKVFPSYSA